MTSKKPFYAAVTDTSTAMAQQLLDTHPELEAVAIVPVYTHDFPELPTGIVLGRNGAVSDPQVLMTAVNNVGRLWAILVSTADRIIAKYRAAINQMHNELEHRQAPSEPTTNGDTRGAPPAT